MKNQISTSDVFLFIPNIIGYFRVILLFVSIILMSWSFSWTAIIIYSISCFLDALDGHFARQRNECSKFGAVLDMVSDRSSTTALSCHLYTMYPKYGFIFPILISLDLSSHYMHMYSSLSSGKSNHKSVNPNAPWLLRSYYSSRIVLFTVCALNELVFILLYIYPLLSSQYLHLWWISMIFSFPIFFFKQTVNIIQLCEASQTLAEMDVNDRK